MTKRLAGSVLMGVGLSGCGMLQVRALQDDRSWLIAIVDRGLPITSCITVAAIGAVLLLKPSQRRAAPFLILGPLMLDAILATVEVRAAGMWIVPAIVVAAVVLGIAVLLTGETRRERIGLRILVGVGLTLVVVLAGWVLLTVDAPFF